jgi:hypothetical protein
MDASVLHHYFFLNSVINCPKTLLVDDRAARHCTAQVMELTHRILQEADDEEENNDEEMHQHAQSMHRWNASQRSGVPLTLLPKHISVSEGARDAVK